MQAAGLQCLKAPERALLLPTRKAARFPVWSFPGKLGHTNYCLPDHPCSVPGPVTRGHGRSRSPKATVRWFPGRSGHPKDWRRGFDEAREQGPDADVSYYLLIVYHEYYLYIIMIVIAVYVYDYVDLYIIVVIFMIIIISVPRPTRRAPTPTTSTAAASRPPPSSCRRTGIINIYIYIYI